MREGYSLAKLLRVLGADELDELLEAQLEFEVALFGGESASARG